MSNDSHGEITSVRFNKETRTIAGDYQPSKVCLKSNEEYTTCGTACPLTCDNYNNPPTFCTKQCIIGCVCKPGYVRNKAGNCVLPCDCKPEVPRCTKKFEVFNPCGSACPPTCDNYKNPPACTKQCVPGCYCKEGYVRNDAGNCVLPCDCEPEVPRCTKKFEVFNPCGSACPLTCNNYKNPPVCTKKCVPGCYCKEGYVRNAAGNCVLPCDCPQVPRCPNNEVYTECGSACFSTCRNHLNPPKICTMQCIVGCQCKEGYVRDEISGKCVLPCDCPATGHKCRLPNEEYSTCGTACPDTCDNYKKPRACTLQCVEGCFSTEEEQVCPLNEVYDECGSACPLTCNNYNSPSDVVCTANCVVGCRCQDNYVRNEEDGTCCLETGCPVCPQNQVYNTCGTACPLTCENYKNPPKFCTRQFTNVTKVMSKDQTVHVACHRNVQVKRQAIS
ncbi:hypothetical protein HA402_007508 [Bradysia odoriphaga]|nr:hypothetical protein HA402_007508 [Bradysia odoriphaga]